MTPEQKALLKPWSELYRRLLDRLARMDSPELKDLYEAAQAATEGKCIFYTHRMADVLKREIPGVFARRTLAEIRAADEAEIAAKDRTHDH